MTMVTTMSVIFFILSLMTIANTKSVHSGIEDPCIGEPCQNEGYCVVASNNTFLCFCPSGWTGPTCGVEEDPCAGSPCQNGGTCNPDDDFIYTCSCETGWKGNDCDEPDPCAFEKCPEGAVCLQRDNDFVCVCFNDDDDPYFCDEANSTGDETGPCTSSPCLNGGTCEENDDEDEIYGYTCTCTDDWTGYKCQESVADPCATTPCQNGGTCISDKDDGTYSCNCAENWSGDSCEESAE